MKQQSQIQKANKGDNSPKVFNDLLKSLGAVLSKLYKEHSTTVILLIFIFLVCGFLLFRTIDVSYLYSVFVTFLFIILSITLYAKEKNFLSAITSFILGIFAASTIPWNGSNFSLFFISFILLITIIFFIAAVRAAADKEEKLTTAANSYLNDFETNMKDLTEVYDSVQKQAGLLPIGKKIEAILFFSYQKVPKRDMVTLIETEDFLYTMTKLDTEILLTLLNNVYCLSHTENDFLVNRGTLKLYILKGKSTPKGLMTILNDTLYIAIENDINFLLFTDTILAYLSRGHTQASIAEQLSKKFEKQTP